jgi:hypothetical protein
MKEKDLIKTKKKMDWSETKKELETNENGELVVKRVTLEAVKQTKKAFGFEVKDLIDLIMKLSTLIAIVFTAFGYFNTLRIIDYQKNADLDKFNQQKKFEAVSELKKTYSELAVLVSEMVFDREPKDIVKVRNSVKECKAILRERSFFFEDNDLANFSACFWIYQGLSYSPENEWRLYYQYIGNVDHNFNVLCRKILALKQKDDFFPFIGMPSETGAGVNAKTFLDTNFEEWIKLTKDSTYFRQVEYLKKVGKARNDSINETKALMKQKH